MELIIRAVSIDVRPADTSGFNVTIECSDAEAVRESVLRGPDDAADDWPLAKRYGEVCDRARALEAEAAANRNERHLDDFDINDLASH